MRSFRTTRAACDRACTRVGCYSVSVCARPRSSCAQRRFVSGHMTRIPVTGRSEAGVGVRVARVCSEGWYSLGMEVRGGAGCVLSGVVRMPGVSRPVISCHRNCALVADCVVFSSARC